MKDKHEILSRYVTRQVSPEERREFETWMRQLPPGEREALLEEYGRLVAARPRVEDAPNRELLKVIQQSIREEEGRVRHMNKWWIAAASILILVAATYFFWTKRDGTPVPTNHTTLAQIQPGRNGAVLTLGDGTEIVLDSVENGLVSEQNGTRAMMDNGTLSYETGQVSSSQIAYNVMTTPNGRQFHLQLPDGTGVWLNAASSIRFPTAFNGNERSVSITGEVYFEVAKNAGQPFMVETSEQVVRVLGTRFNINAYKNGKSQHTTLLEGSVSISVNGQQIVLKPGQQAQIKGSITVKENANLEQALAWKNGLFNFDNISLQEAMQQIERWYDITVVYENDDIPEIPFSGEINRNMSLPNLLKLLERTKLTFRVEEGKKLVIGK